jgi:3-oxoacyl-[acyl-carrier-protein] synthase III
MSEIHIKSVAHYVPAGRLTNEEVLTRVSRANGRTLSSDELELLLYGSGRKFDFLGIRTRSVCLDGDNTVTMAVAAGQAALRKADLPAAGIECLIATGVSNPYREPSFAAVIARQLGVESADFFDVNDTCNGFLKAIDVASQYLKTGRYRNILIVTSENPYETAAGFGIDYAIGSMAEADNRFSILTVGCGAAAMVLGTDGDGKVIIDYKEKRETANWNASLFTVPGVYLPDAAHGNTSPGVWTDARLVSARVIREIPGFILEALGRWNMTLDDISLILMHQLGNNVTYATLDLLRADRGKAPVNTFNEFGNMASANIPVSLSLAEERGLIKKGDNVLLVSSACGLSYSLVRIRY